MNPSPADVVELAADVDRRLAEHMEFGDAAAIEQRALARLRAGLAALGRRQPSLVDRSAVWSHADAGPLRALLRDPALRNAFERDITLLRDPSPEFAPVLDELLPAEPAEAKTGLASSLANPSAQAWSHVGDTWVWTEIPERADEAVSRRLWAGLRSLFPNPTAEVPITPTPTMLTGIERGATLLTELLPQVGSGVLRHVGMIGLARDSDEDGTMLSLSGGDGLPCTIFVAPELVQNPWDAAGMILHEALHLQLFEILRCGELTVIGPEATTPAILIPWREMEWSVMRVLFALHVYVHMTLFETAASVAPPEMLERYGPPLRGAAMTPPSPGSARTHATPLERAAYLGEQLERVVPDRLSPYGLAFASWLVDVLEVMAPGVRDGWTHPVPTPVESTVDRESPVNGRLRATEPADAVPVPEQSRLVVAAGDTGRLHWLNLASWTVYALCDGRDATAVEAEYLEIVDAVSDPAEATAACRTGIAGLLHEGLIEVETP